MLRIGIVGSENSHTAQVAKIINVEKKFPGVAVVAVWGETDEVAAKAAQAGQIPTVVKDPKEMIGKVEGVMVDHRHAKFHIPAMEPFLAARIPMFIDKPLCYRLAEGRDFLARCRQAGVPVTSVSSVALQGSFRQFAQKVVAAGKVYAACSAGPIDIHSPYGNIFFYGIHQIDPLVALLGTEVAAAQVTEFGPKRAAALIYWRSGVVASMHCIDGWDTGFQFGVTTAGGPLAFKVIDDANSTLPGTEVFVKMFQTGQEPFHHQRMLAPIAVLEALEKSQTSGKIEAIEGV
jgi:predicted dehydrogenase